jgi:hypothetical protein
VLSAPLSRADFDALRELAVQRDQGVGAGVKARLVAGGWLEREAPPYELTGKARRFMREMSPRRVRLYYAVAALVLARAASCMPSATTPATAIAEVITCR